MSAQLTYFTETTLPSRGLRAPAWWLLPTGYCLLTTASWLLRDDSCGSLQVSGAVPMPKWWQS